MQKFILLATSMLTLALLPMTTYATAQADNLQPTDNTWTDNHQQQLLLALNDEAIPLEDASIVIIQNTSRTTGIFQAMISHATTSANKFTFYKWTSSAPQDYYRIGVPSSAPNVTGYNITATGHFELSFDQNYNNGGTFDTTLGTTTNFIDPIRHDYHGDMYNIQYHSSWDKIRYQDKAKETVRPEIEYKVVDKQLTAKYLGNMLPSAFLNWKIVKDDNSVILPYDKETSSTLNYTFTDYGTYTLWVQASYKMPQQSPYKLDQYNPPPYLLGLEFTIDGQDYSGNSIDCQEYDADCNAQYANNVYEQCEQFDILCHMRNGLLMLQRWLGIEKTETNPSGSPFVGNEIATHGVASIITAPLFIFESISQTEYSCSAISLPLPSVTGSIQLPCLYNFYQETAGPLFTMYQVIISGLISYYLLVHILEIVKNAKNPKTDRLEVYHL